MTKLSKEDRLEAEKASSNKTVAKKIKATTKHVTQNPHDLLAKNNLRRLMAKADEIGLVRHL